MTQRSHARSTALIAIGQASVKLSQLVLTVLLVRMLSPADWNATAYVLSVYLAATMIGTFNLQHNIVFFLPRAGVHRRAFVLQNASMLAAVGTVIALALVVAAPALSGGRFGSADQLRWLALAIALELPCACGDMTLIALQRFGSAALWDIAGTAVLLLATVGPVVAGAGTGGVVAGLVVAAFVRLLGTLAVVTLALDGPLRGLERGTLRRQLQYGLPLGISVAASMLNRLVDKWFVAVFDGDDFGIYSIAAQEVPLLSVLPYAGGAAIVVALVDAFRSGDLGLARAHWIHLTRSMSSVVVPVSIALVLIAPDVLRLVFTDRIGPGVLSFQLFTLITVHRVAEYGMVLRAAGRTRDLIVVSTFTLCANAVLAGFGAAIGGMTGASLGTVVASLLGWMVALRRIGSALQVPMSQAFAWRAWSAMVAICAASAFAAWAVVARVLDGAAPVWRIVLQLLAYAAAVTLGSVLWRRSPHSAVPDVMIVPPCQPAVGPRDGGSPRRERSDAFALATEALG